MPRLLQESFGAAVGVLAIVAEGRRDVEGKRGTDTLNKD